MTPESFLMSRLIDELLQGNTCLCFHPTESCQWFELQEYEITQYLFKWVTLFSILLMKIIYTFCVVKQLQL